jgi:hypothetical protein
MYDQELNHVITTAFSRITSELEQSGPFLAQQVSNWMEHWSRPTPPEDAFKHPLSFPMLLLPWWLEKTLQSKPDPSFQADLVYSTVNGYYYIRLIDNLMDGHATVELKLLPALNFFHTHFQMPYQRYFQHDHPFWEYFTSIWFHSAEVTMKDANLANIDLEQFTQVTAQKTCAVKIPIAAVCYRYERPELIKAWAQFVDLFGCWHQMQNDIFDWRKDAKNQTRTYFLLEAERRKAATESVTEWVIRAGFDWGSEMLEVWMAELKAQAGDLHSADLAAYLEQRGEMMRQRKEEIADGLQSAAKLLALLDQSAGR